MTDWQTPILITGPIVFPGLGESSAISVSIISTLAPVWRKAGYLRVEVLINSKFSTVSYSAIDFGESFIAVPFAAYRLSFDPVRDLTTIYPNTSISIYQLSPTEVKSISMSGTVEAITRAIGPDVPVTTPAAVASTLICAANVDRVPSGVIVNNSTKIMWVNFAGAVATAAAPNIPIPANGGNWDIPSGYTGAINAIWVSGATGSCVAHTASYI